MISPDLIHCTSGLAAAVYTKFAIPTPPEAFSLPRLVSSDRHLEGSNKMLQSHLSSKGQNQPTKPHPHPRFVSRCHPAPAPRIFPWRQFIPHPISPISRSPSGQPCRYPAWFFSFAIALPARTHSNALYMRDIPGPRYMPPQGVAGYDAATSQWERIGGPPSISRTQNLPTLGDRSLPVVFQTFVFPVGCGQLTTVAYYYTVDRHELL